MNSIQHQRRQAKSFVISKPSLSYVTALTNLLLSEVFRVLTSGEALEHSQNALFRGEIEVGKV